MLGCLQPFLGRVTLYRGDSSAARRLLDESLRLCTELRDKGYLARVCTFLAETALWEEDVQAAQWLARSLGYDANPSRITINTVELLWVAARLATAQQQYLRAATLFGVADQAQARSTMRLPGQCAPWPTPRWRRCVGNWSRRSLPRRLRWGAAS